MTKAITREAILIDIKTARTCWKALHHIEGSQQVAKLIELKSLIRKIVRELPQTSCGSFQERQKLELRAYKLITGFANFIGVGGLKNKSDDFKRAWKEFRKRVDLNQAATRLKEIRHDIATANQAQMKVQVPPPTPDADTSDAHEPAKKGRRNRSKRLAKREPSLQQSSGVEEKKFTGANTIPLGERRRAKNEDADCEVGKMVTTSTLTEQNSEEATDNMQEDEEEGEEDFVRKWVQVHEDWMEAGMQSKDELLWYDLEKDIDEDLLP